MESCVVVWDTGFLEVSAARTPFYSIFAPGTIGEMGLHYTKLEEMARSAVIPTNIHSITPRSRRHKQSIPPIMKNERHKPTVIF